VCVKRAFRRYLQQPDGRAEQHFGRHVRRGAQLGGKRRGEVGSAVRMSVEAGGERAVAQELATATATAYYCSHDIRAVPRSRFQSNTRTLEHSNTRTLEQSKARTVLRVSRSPAASGIRPCAGYQGYATHL
jgi:hypothetical protein